VSERMSAEKTINAWRIMARKEPRVAEMIVMLMRTQAKHLITRPSDVPIEISGEIACMVDAAADLLAAIGDPDE
jgi:hypothetical protein